jgi:hypothetical protein
MVAHPGLIRTMIDRTAVFGKQEMSHGRSEVLSQTERAG